MHTKNASIMPLKNVYMLKVLENCNTYFQKTSLFSKGKDKAEVVPLISQEGCDTVLISWSFMTLGVY